MTVGDFILDYLASIGTKHVFLVTGGAIAFVVDKFHGKKNISYICVQHEQAAAMAADGYSRVSNAIGATMVTSGPGATNLITGICSSWFDSIPTIHISGQVNTFEQKGNSGVRQIGFQETDIVSMVKSVTKFAQQLDKPENIKYLLQKATYIALSGRPGPVLLDIPQNFQRVEINPEKLKSFVPSPQLPKTDSEKILNSKIDKIIKLINSANRPLLLAGGGIRLSKAEKEVLKLANILGFPIVSSWSGVDTVPFDFKHRLGCIGVCGDRYSNFAVQNADLILSIGSRLDTRQTASNVAAFAPKAKKIVVDIDAAELNKKRGLVTTIKVHSDAKRFINALVSSKQRIKIKDISAWTTRCAKWKKDFPIVRAEYYKDKLVNPYIFMETLSKELPKDAIITSDTGATIAWTIQAFKVKEGQILFSAQGNSPMGYSLPAAIGASISLGKKEVICIIGDGGVQLNLQELQTAVHNKLPLKIFIVNNHGFGIIKQFQRTWLDSRFEASGSGYSAPDFVKIGKAYGIKTFNIDKNNDIKKTIKQVLNYKKIAICNIEVEKNQKISPRVEYGKPLENMYPFLSPKVVAKNMLEETS